MIHNQALDSIQHYHQIYIKEVSFQQARQYIYIYFSLAFDRRETETVKKTIAITIAELNHNQTMR